jgi:dTDP-4-dehydrorhamnose reductase
MSDLRIAITGARGQLATDLLRVLEGFDVLPLSHQQLDICDEAAVDDLFSSSRPDVLINTAAFHRVDDCEEQSELAFRVNAYGVSNLARACQKTRCVLVHISTDYVFDGEKMQPYIEEDSPRPINMYGVSKLAGELAIRYMLNRYFIVRSSGLYGHAGASGKGGNFVNTMLRLAEEGRPIRVVDDQYLSPTYTLDLASKIAWLITKDNFGIYHITNSGHCSWFGFARAIFDEAALDVKVAPTTTEAFKAKAPRPPFSALDHGALRALGADDMRPWREALRSYLQEIGVV